MARASVFLFGTDEAFSTTSWGFQKQLNHANMCGGFPDRKVLGDIDIRPFGFDVAKLEQLLPCEWKYSSDATSCTTLPLISGV